MKLNKALKKLRQTLEKKPGSKEAQAEAKEVLNLLAGVIASSMPESLKQCMAGKAPGEEINPSQLLKVLLDNVDDSVKGILEENAILAKGGLAKNVAKLIKLASGMEATEKGQSLFAKVAATTEGALKGEVIDQKLQEEGHISGEYYRSN